MSQVLKSSRTDQPNASLRAFRSIPHTRDLFRGYFTLAGRNLPFTALQYPMFEASKAWLLRGRERDGVVTTIQYSGLAAGGSGAIAATVTTPVDVVKTRIMLSAGKGGSSSIPKVVREVLREEGWRGFWRGGALRAVWTCVGMGLYLGVYEGAKFYFVRRREDREGRRIDVASGLRTEDSTP